MAVWLFGRATERAVDPVAGHLERLERQVTRLEHERRSTAGGLAEMVRGVTEQVEGLRRETGSLAGALRRPAVRGAWGELQLRGCVEAAGMTRHVDFTEQTLLDGGRLRPDMVVRLPGGGEVAVDAKVPLDAYLDSVDAEGEAREALLARHAKRLRAHVDALAARGYQDHLGRAPEFVVCFVPNEAVYAAALDADPQLLGHGAAHGVLLATPTTLMALLHAVRFGWREDRLAESAREVADAGRELHRRVATFVEPFARLGRQLGSAVGAYNESVGSFEARVMPQLRRMEDAGAGSARPLAAPEPLDTAPRLVA